MFDDQYFDNVRDDANQIWHFLRNLCPFEPHRLPADDLEYTTMPEIMKKLEHMFEKIA